MRLFVIVVSVTNALLLTTAICLAWITSSSSTQTSKDLQNELQIQAEEIAQLKSALNKYAVVYSSRSESSVQICVLYLSGIIMQVTLIRFDGNVKRAIIIKVSNKIEYSY